MDTCSNNSNFGLFYNKEIYSDIKGVDKKNEPVFNEKDTIKRKIEELFKINMPYEIAEEVNKKLKLCTNCFFSLTTTYPGLLIGSGYAHGLNNNKDDFRIGFYLDFTTGLPIIPGSSVKGLIRSAFGGDPDVKSDKYYLQKRKYIMDIIVNKLGVKWSNDTDLIEELKKDIFEGNGKSMKERDSFFEALPKLKNNNSIFKDDYICKHNDDSFDGKEYKEDKLSELTEPTPLKFLKVKEGIEYEFHFNLFDSKIGEYKITAEEKKKLFMIILSDFGIGSKTRVGYGQFDREKIEEEIEISKEEEIQKENEKIQKEIEQLKWPESEYKKKKVIEGANEQELESFLTGLVNSIDTFETDKKATCASFLKKTYMEMGKWNGNISKKQDVKVQKIKGILGKSE